MSPNVELRNPKELELITIIKPQNSGIQVSRQTQSSVLKMQPKSDVHMKKHATVQATSSQAPSPKGSGPGTSQHSDIHTKKSDTYVFKGGSSVKTSPKEKTRPKPKEAPFKLPDVKNPSNANDRGVYF